MIASLHIENIAVIKKLDVDFSKGFTVFTGETGAGKSIIIDGISLLLGAKGDKQLIRTGESYAMVSGVFTDISSGVIAAMEECGVYPDEEGNILIQRTITCDGRSQIKINARTVTLSVLKAVTPLLMVIHGQNDTSSITDSKNQLEIIDSYAANGALLEQYRAEYDKWVAIKDEIEEITRRQAEGARQIEILRYQIRDIDSVSPAENEEDELIDKKVKIKNSEKITKNAGFAYKALKGSEKGSISFLLEKSITALDQLTDVLPELAESVNSLRETLYVIEDVSDDVYSVISDKEDDPTEALNKIESRLDKISKLKRKYGLTVADVLAFRDNARHELEVLENSDDILRELSAKENKAYAVALKLANELHERRTVAAKEIEETVKKTLEFLDMPKVVFFVSIKEEFHDEKKILFSSGSDKIDFYISANKGASAQPLAKIASGGELARIMLAIKSAITAKDGIGTVIFDEIDAGVSGKTARKIGIKMRELSASVQLMCVTHSAQIASLADAHMLIRKSDVDAGVETSVAELDYNGRVSELSRILGGLNVTESQRLAAEDMLNERNL